MLLFSVWMMVWYCFVGGGDGIFCCMQFEQIIFVDCDFVDVICEMVMCYYFSWKYCDIDVVMVFYYFEVEYNDFFQNCWMCLVDFCEYVEVIMFKGFDELLEYIDCICFDGDIVFIQYCLWVIFSGCLVLFCVSEVIIVCDGLIWCINEYVLLVYESGGGVQVGGDGWLLVSCLGFLVKQLSLLVCDLEYYFQQVQFYFDLDLDLIQVVNVIGYMCNQIFYLFNQVFGLSFYQYVNQICL